MIEGGGKVIHVDPTSPGNYEGLPPADVVLITDIHGDHMDPKALSKVQKAGTVIFAPEAVAKTVTTATVIQNGETKMRAIGRSKPSPCTTSSAVRPRASCFTTRAAATDLC